MLRILYNGFLLLIIGFISFASIYLGRTLNPWWMITLGVGLFICVYLHSRSEHNRLGILLLLLLFMFHWSSQLNWCLSIYVIIIVHHVTRINNLSQSILLTLAVMMTYSVIRLSYSEINHFSVLNSFSDIISSLGVMALVLYINVTEIEKKRLKERVKQNDELFRYDVLTGLPNYQEFRRILDITIGQNKKICVIILDWNNIKMTDVQYGYEHVNEILIQIGEELQRSFQDALISRYGSGEFALAFEYESESNVIEKIENIVEGQLPQTTGIHLLYGLSFANGKNSLEVIADVENQLVLKKRESWLKRDEHIFRADKLKVIGELAAGMAHEIRNPLTTIKGFLQLASEDKYMNMMKYHDIVMSEISRVAELTEEFLQFSKPNATKLKEESIQSCIQRAVSIMATEVARNGHLLTVEMEEVLLIVEIDKDKIVQVLINLIKNSIDAMRELGEIVIKEYQEDSFVVVVVKDNGTGMSAETKDKLFNPFFTTRAHGTGLGLPITHKIVQDHGGIIDVESVLGEGTTFVIRLPLAYSQKGLTLL